MRIESEAQRRAAHRSSPGSCYSKWYASASRTCAGAPSAPVGIRSDMNFHQARLVSLGGVRAVSAFRLEVAEHPVIRGVDEERGARDLLALQLSGHLRPDRIVPPAVLVHIGRAQRECTAEPTRHASRVPKTVRIASRNPSPFTVSGSNDEPSVYSFHALTVIIGCGCG